MFCPLPELQVAEVLAVNEDEAVVESVDMVVLALVVDGESGFDDVDEMGLFLPVELGVEAKFVVVEDVVTVTEADVVLAIEESDGVAEQVLTLRPLLNAARPAASSASFMPAGRLPTMYMLVLRTKMKRMETYQKR